MSEDPHKKAPEEPQEDNKEADEQVDRNRQRTQYQQFYYVRRHGFVGDAREVISGQRSPEIHSQDSMSETEFSPTSHRDLIQSPPPRHHGDVVRIAIRRRESTLTPVTM